MSSNAALPISWHSTWVRIALLALGLLLCSTLIGVAKAAVDLDHAWIVAKVTGEAFVAENEQQESWKPLTGGEILDGHQVVATGPEGALVLTHGDDVVHLSSKSVVSLRDTNGKGGVTRLSHTIGKILVDVEKRPGWQFQVETPYLTGVVKGTSFTVTVGDDGAEVDVHHGIVGVSDRAGRSSTDVKAGQTARVSSEAGSKVSVGPSATSTGTVSRSVAPTAASQASDSDVGSGEGGSSGSNGKSSDGGGSSSGGSKGKGSDGGGSSSSGGKGKGSDGGGSSSSGGKGKDDGGGSSDSGKSGKDKGDKSKDSEGDKDGKDKNGKGKDKD
jgi:collagen type III alpha